MSREAALSAIGSTDVDARARALVAVSLHDPDGEWVANLCAELLDDNDSNMRAVAATCLGHVARIHPQIDLKRVVPVLRRLASDPVVGGRASDALDDIALYRGRRDADD
jgi:hypothetical protein